MGDKDVGYVTAEELFSDPQPCLAFENVRKSIAEQSSRPIVFSNTHAGRQAAAWSELGGLIVGEEYKGPQNFP